MSMRPWLAVIGNSGRRGAAAVAVIALSLGLVVVSPVSPAVAGPFDEAVLVEDAIRFGEASSDPEGLVDVDGTLFFAATDQGERELWKTDGTDVGTSKVDDINPGPTRSSSPEHLTAVGDRVFFSAFDGFDVELWTSDGTAFGTRLVKDINTIGGDTTPIELTAVGDVLYFSAFDGRFRELWKSDGTTAGTRLVKDILREGSGDPLNLTDVAGTLYFTAIDGAGRELWKSDGTAAGTTRVKDIEVGGFSSRPSLLTVVGDTLFFAAIDKTHGTELWKSDGTAAGTVLVKDINPGMSPSVPSELTNVDGTLFFSAITSDGKELWKSDGTAAGTVQVADIAEGPDASVPLELASVGGRLLFSAEVDGDRELWTSDGTPAGTRRVKDIAPDSSSEPRDLTVVDDIAYFVATDQARGREVWRTDGTSAGTELVADIAPGSSSSSPEELTTSGSRLFMSADDGSRGRELWRAVDTLPPMTSITFGPQEGSTTTDSPVTLGFESDDSPSTFQCRFVLTGPGQEPPVAPEFQTCASPSSHTLSPDPSPGTEVVFEVRAIDVSGNVDPTPAIRTFIVGGPDSAPVAVDDFATVAQDSAATAIDVLANDTDIDGGPLRIASFTQPSAGTVMITGRGTGLTYAPNMGYCNVPGGVQVGRPGPPDVFTYTLNGGSTARVEMRVACTPDPVDQPPVALDDFATVDEGSSAAQIDVLANDTDVDGGPLRIESVTQPANGAVALAADGASVSYAAGRGYCNDPGGLQSDRPAPPDVFTYTLNGGSTARVAVRVRCVPDPVDEPSDTSPPETTITTPGLLGSSLWLKQQGAFSFIASEAGATFECRLDGGPFVPCASPHTLAIPFGRHTFAVRAVDRAGNVDPTPATKRVLVLALF